ncbi:asparagine synthetase B [Agrobacterium vitis]|uniref:asparagine synthase (glutamine-hydrolyzing) n=1 Tax=Agrobacterium vitis TaxID=373 RepID=UPI0015D6AC36|nr:asparagine synthase (glutamine-hydrolyzing) [Agrobacterium vitis]BCH61725.1 asparagine synthetase B [Agrobacterium vitis]
MCGIAGSYAPDGACNPQGPDEIVAMLARIGHRGPDEAGYYRDDRCTLGMVRLSILDLASGQQPMASPSQRYWCCFNGEIYNYVELRQELQSLHGMQFRTDGDTEVLLRAWEAWGAACLPRLNGAFAFAIYDRETKALVLARDRFGKRPLFWAKTNGRYVFASEIKAFLGCSGISFETDPAHFAAILASWTPSPDQTGWKGIETLPIGGWMEIAANGTVKSGRYTTLDFKPRQEFSSMADAAEAVRAALIRAVTIRMRSDVPVGLYLSGGLDSTIIAAILADLPKAEPISSYSIGFEDEGLDEGPFQDLASKRFGTRHTTVRASHRDICNAFAQAVYHAEVPVFRTAFVPMFLLSQRVQSDGIKTILSGEGSDEVFLGYDLFRETMLRESWAGLDTETRRMRVSRLNPYLKHFANAPGAGMVGLYDQFATERLPGLFSHEIRYQNGNLSLRLLADRALAARALNPLMTAAAQAPGFVDMTAVEKAQWLEFNTLLPGYLLSTQGERMGMAHGVENRCPFLDPNVVAMAGSVNLKHDDGWTEKAVLKHAFPELPEEIRTRHKHPYRAADSKSFVLERPDYLEMVLSAQELGRSGLIDTRFAERLVTKIMTQPSDRISVSENQAFVSLLSFQMLQHQYVRREGLPAVSQAYLRERLTVSIEERLAA